jgi:UDP:flavonoid glycosyltransferase YjiC (YdhE family)
MTRSPVIAIVSLVPDLGHVIPLMKIGAALQRAGASVVCFLPDSCAGLRSQYPLELRSGGPRTSARTRQLAASFGHSYLGRTLISHALLRYFAAVRYDASLALGGLRAALDQLAPDVVLADPHGLEPWIRYLARSCGADLILHESEGTLRRWQSLPVQLRGLAPRPPLHAMIHRGLAYLERTAARTAERALRWHAGPDWPEHPATLAHVAAALKLAERAPAQAAALRPFRASPITLPQTPPTHAAAPLTCRERVMTTGIAPLELREARPGLVVPRGVAWFGPLRGDPAPLSEEHQRWLSAGGRVVYISFGTMLRVDRELMRAMCDALAALGLRGLWAIPAARAPALVGLTVPSHVRIEPHVPQIAVLQRPEVVCCVTHAGAGTVQESLWAGKPLLCVPALWDQFYNASWVEHRGAGLRVAPHRATASSLRRALSLLVHQPSYAASARQLSRAFEAAGGEAHLVAFVAQVVRERRARRGGAARFVGAPKR